MKSARQIFLSLVVSGSSEQKRGNLTVVQKRLLRFAGLLVVIAVMPAVAGPRTLSAKALNDGCAAVTISGYDNIYSLLKNARNEAEADKLNTKLGNEEEGGRHWAKENRDALDGVLTHMQADKAYWMSHYGGGGLRRAPIIAAEALQIFLFLESDEMIPKIDSAQRAAMSEEALSSPAANRGWASFDLISQALKGIDQMRVNAGHCYMADYR